MPDPRAAVDRLRTRGWMQTFTGVKFNVLHPRAEDVRIEDIAHGLAYTCRYGGQATRYYSVAEHCVIMSRFMPAARHLKQALLHDSAEAYIGDLIRPVKHQPELAEFRKIESKIEVQVFKRFGIDSTAESDKAVKLTDNRILIDEITQLMADPKMYLESPAFKGLAPLGVTVRCWEPALAEHMFLNRYKDLFDE